MRNGCLPCYERPVRRAALLCALALSPSVARAVEGETSLSLSARYATLSVTRPGEDAGGWGGGLVVDGQRALSDSLWLRAALGGAALTVDGEAAYLGCATFGVTWAVDVLKYVPYVGIGAGALVVGGGTLDTQVEPYVELGVGVDVIVSTGFSWGLDARLSSFAGDATVLLVGPRLTWRWGYF